MNPGALRETQLRENVWVWTLGGDRIESSYGANCTAVVGRQGVLLVDPLIAPAHARLVEAALRTKTDLPVSIVVLTHHHTDHALGASWFAARGGAVYAHPACAQAMSREHPGLIAARRRDPALAALFADAEPPTPATIPDDSDLFIHLGDCDATVFHPGPGHTRGDLAVHLERESLTICGDLVSAGYHVNYEDAVLKNLENGLDVLGAHRARTYVPGHGSPGGPELLEKQRRYHRAVAAATDPDALRAQFPGYLLEQVLR